MDFLYVSPWHLKYFYDAVRFKSLTKASNLNGITRPAISKAISTLDNTLGVQLLKHGRRTVEPTKEGLQLYERIPSVLEAFRNLKDITLPQSQTPSGHLRVGTSHSLATAMFPRLLQVLMRKFPGLNISLQLGRTETLRNWIHEGTIDVAVSLDDRRLNDFHRMAISSGRFLLFQPEHKSGEIIFTTFDRPEVRALRKYLKRKKINKDIAFIEIDSWEVLYRFAKQGMGLGLVPDFVLGPSDKPSGKFSDFSFQYEMVAFYSKDRPMTLNMNALIEELKAFF